MSATPSLPRPGVVVLRVRRTTTPTILTPTLVPCIIGVCKQIVEATTQTSSGARVLNSSALVQLPASFLAAAAPGDPAAYTSLNGKKLVFTVKGGSAITVTFSGTNLTPRQVVAQVLDALAAASVTDATAEVSGTSQWMLRTTGAGEFESLKVLVDYDTAKTDPEVLAAFGLGANKEYWGSTGYAQSVFEVPIVAFPDPRGNLAEVAIDPSTVRAFVAMGSSISNVFELSKTSGFLRRGGTNTAATLTGSANLSLLTYPTALTDKTFKFEYDGTVYSLKFDDTLTNAASVATFINTQVGKVICAIVTNSLKFTSLRTGALGYIRIVEGTALAVLGFTVNQDDRGTSAVEAIDDGNGDATTSILVFDGEDFTTAASAATVTGTEDISGGIADGKTLELWDGHRSLTHTFQSASTGADVVSHLEDTFGVDAGGYLAFSLSTNNLVITHTLTGEQSVFTVVGGTAVADIGLTVATTRGDAHPPAVGDELYVGGQRYASIVQVAPGGNVDQLKINKQVPIAPHVGLHFFIMAKALPATGRPEPELRVSDDGSIKIRHELIRDVSGAPVSGATGRVYISYTGVRQDVTALASNAALLRFSSTTEIEDLLEPVDERNPFALGLYFAALNAPAIQLSGIGVDAVSADAPYGTVEAFTRAAEFLEAYEVYALALLTHDLSVGRIYQTHAEAMSAPEARMERVVLFCSEMPTRKLDTLVASGTGNSSSSTTFVTGVANLSSLVQSAGVESTGTIPVEDGLYLDIGSDSKHYNISSISGGTVTIRTSFTAGQNDDGFFAETALDAYPLPASLIDEPFAVRIRGAALEKPDGTPDKQLIAETVAALSASFGSIRLWHIFPDRCAATIGGVEKNLPGFYMCAAYAGMIGQQAPQQSFTNLPMTGITRVIGSTGYFTETQLNQIAGGGTWIVEQQSPQAAPSARYAITTDVSSLEMKSDNINKCLDYAQKFIRIGLRTYIGRFNINQGYLDSLGQVSQGLIGFLVDTGVLLSGDLNNVIQDEENLDTVLIDFTVAAPVAANFIRVSLYL